MNATNVPGRTGRALSFRLLTLDDLVTCCELETAAHSHPWNKNQMLAALQRYFCWGLERDGELLAFAVVACVAEEAELLDFVVSPGSWGQGIGTTLLQRLLQWLQNDSSANGFFLEVRESNQRALALYRNGGFAEVGVRRNYYPTKSGREDAILMAMELC